MLNISVITQSQVQYAKHFTYFAFYDTWANKITVKYEKRGINLSYYTRLPRDN